MQKWQELLNSLTFCFIIQTQSSFSINTTSTLNYTSIANANLCKLIRPFFAAHYLLQYILIETAEVLPSLSTLCVLSNVSIESPVLKALHGDHWGRHSPVLIMKQLDKWWPHFQAKPWLDGLLASFWGFWTCKTGIQSLSTLHTVSHSCIFKLLLFNRNLCTLSNHILKIHCYDIGTITW